MLLICRQIKRMYFLLGMMWIKFGSTKYGVEDGRVARFIFCKTNPNAEIQMPRNSINESEFVIVGFERNRGEFYQLLHFLFLSNMFRSLTDNRWQPKK